MFFLKVLVLTILLLIAIIILFYGINPNIEENYCKAYINKRNRVVSLQENKMIFVGGSNVNFAIESKTIQDTFNKKVVNMGFVSGLGAKFQLNVIQPYLKAGDVVVLSFEYPYFFEEGLIIAGSGINMCMFYRTDPTFLDYFPMPESFIIIMKEVNALLVSQYLGNILLKLNPRKKPLIETTPYIPESHNEFGDNVSKLVVDISTKRMINNVVIQFNNDTAMKMISMLNEFNNHCKNIGVKCVFSFATYEKEMYKKNKENIQKIHTLMKEKLQIPLINSPENCSYEYIYYFDTVYHLNKTGKQIHTQKLIQDLKKYL